MDVRDQNVDKPHSRIWLNILLLSILTIGVIIWIFTQNDMEAVWNTISQTNIYYLLVALLITAIYWFLTDLSLHNIVRSEAENQISLFDSFNVSNSVYFFNGVTPFSSAGQPFQIYYFRKFGIPTATSAGVVMMNFIIYQLVMTSLSVVGVFFFYQYLMGVDHFAILVLIGVVINTTILLCLIGCAISKKFKMLCMGILSLITKIKPLQKRREKILTKMDKFIIEFQICFKKLFTKKITLFFSLLFTVGSLIAYYAVPYFIICALGVTLPITKIFYIIGMTSFALTIMSWMPTPGATGAAEWAFKDLFMLPIIGITNSVAVAGMLLWRFITYYLGMLQGLISVLILGFRKKKQEEKEKQ